MSIILSEQKGKSLILPDDLFSAYSFHFSFDKWLLFSRNNHISNAVANSPIENQPCNDTHVCVVNWMEPSRKQNLGIINSSQFQCATLKHLKCSCKNRGNE